MRGEENIGGLSHPSKMPCDSWSTPAERCQTGSKLRAIPGTTCSSCYAHKGCYTFRSTREATARRYDVLTEALQNPERGVQFIETFARILSEKHRRTLRAIERTGEPPKGGDGRYFRWHDSGDIQSTAHLLLIVHIARAVPQVRFWLPTREVGYVRDYLRYHKSFPENLTVRLSVPRIDGTPSGALDALLEHEQVTVSGVHTPGTAPSTFEACDANDRGGACGPCRRCWDPERAISYPLH